MSEEVEVRSTQKSIFKPGFRRRLEVIVNPNGLARRCEILHFRAGHAIDGARHTYFSFGAFDTGEIGELLEGGYAQDTVFLSEVSLENYGMGLLCRLRLLFEIEGGRSARDLYGPGGELEHCAQVTIFIKKPGEEWIGEYEENADFQFSGIPNEEHIIFVITSQRYCDILTGLPAGTEMWVVFHAVDDRPYLEHDVAIENPYERLIKSVEARVRGRIKYRGKEIPIVEERDNRHDMYLLRPRFLWDFDRDKECTYQDGQLEIEAYADRGRFRDAFVYDLLQRIARNLDTLAADGWTPDGVPRLATDVIEVEAAEDQYHHGYLSMTAGT